MKMLPLYNISLGTILFHFPQFLNFETYKTEKLYINSLISKWVAYQIKTLNSANTLMHLTFLSPLVPTLQLK